MLRMRCCKLNYLVDSHPNQVYKHLHIVRGSIWATRLLLIQYLVVSPQQMKGALKHANVLTKGETKAETKAETETETEAKAEAKAEAEAETEAETEAEDQAKASAV